MTIALHSLPGRAPLQPMSTPTESIAVRETPIELAQFLKFAGVAATGGEAKQVITAGEVRVNGEVETRRGRKLAIGDRVELGPRSFVLRAP